MGAYRRFREEALDEWLDELERRSVNEHAKEGQSFRRTGYRAPSAHRLMPDAAARASLYN